MLPLQANVAFKVSIILGIYKVFDQPNWWRSNEKKNLRLLDPTEYTPEEAAFGKKIQEVTGKSQIGMDSKINPL